MQGRKPPRVRKLAPFPAPPPQLAADGAQSLDFALPQHVTQPPPAPAPALTAPAAPAAVNGTAAAQQQASPSVWAKIIEGLDPEDAAAAAAAEAAGAAEPPQLRHGTTAGAGASADAASVGVHSPAAGSSLADGSLADGSLPQAAESPQRSGAGLVPQSVPGAVQEPFGHMQDRLQTAGGGGLDAAVPMDVDEAVLLPEPQFAAHQRGAAQPAMQPPSPDADLLGAAAAAPTAQPSAAPDAVLPANPPAAAAAAAADDRPALAVAAEQAAASTAAAGGDVAAADAADRLRPTDAAATAATGLSTAGDAQQQPGDEALQVPADLQSPAGGSGAAGAAGAEEQQQQQQQNPAQQLLLAAPSRRALPRT